LALRSPLRQYRERVATIARPAGAQSSPEALTVVNHVESFQFLLNYAPNWWEDQLLRLKFYALRAEELSEILIRDPRILLKQRLERFCLALRFHPF
jgi:hypothetical protein